MLIANNEGSIVNRTRPKDSDGEIDGNTANFASCTSPEVVDAADPLDNIEAADKQYNNTLSSVQ